MKLYYSPSFTGFVYTDLTEVMFNEKIVDTRALVDLIKLHAGLRNEKNESINRIVNYYKAVKKYMEKNPENILKASFEVDGMALAKECLKWRDALTFADWNRNVKYTSDRMKVLSEIEQYFTDKSLGEELAEIIDAVKSNCILPENLEIVSLLDYKLFPPLVVDLFEALISRGIYISTKEFSEKNNALSSIIDLIESSNESAVQIKKDDSFQVLHFKEQDDAFKYLSLRPADEYDLWINSDNKVLDNWLRLEGKPSSGSNIKGMLPITQMLSIGLRTLASPLDIENMISWLSIPVSPIDERLRRNLKKKIIKNVGYYNEECKEEINDYINCKNKFELSDEENRLSYERNKRKLVIENFLPSTGELGVLSNDTVTFEKVKTFTEKLFSWCGKQIALIKDEMQRVQIEIVRNECYAVLNILNEEKEDTFTFLKLMDYVSTLSDGIELPFCEAQIGCRTVISNPGQINSPVKKLIWCDFYNEPVEKSMYDFLLPSEKEELKKVVKLWEEDKEREYNRKIKLLPFLLSEKITLVVVDKVLNENTEKPSMHIQMEKKIENFSDFVKYPNITEEYEELVENVSIVDNRMDENDEFLKLENASLIQWPEKESYSSLEKLVNDPVDYIFLYLAEIKPIEKIGKNSLNLTKGNVVHRVIKDLFNSGSKTERIGTEEYIKDNFDNVFLKNVNAYGATLLLRENSIGLGTYKSQVKECVDKLAELIKKNKLHVEECEQSKEAVLTNNLKINGRLDMTLSDEHNDLVVFDFKWTNKKDNYVELLKENKSIQLELYKYLIKESDDRNVKAVAYVILPSVTVISTEQFIGDNAISVTIKEEDLVKKIENSYHYRKSQISDGNIDIDNVVYQRDVEEEDLFPLEEKKPEEKKKNDYSDYKLFKKRKR